mgnify:CR=1 FL=1
MNAHIDRLRAACERDLDDPATWPTPVGYPNSLALCIIDAIYVTGARHLTIDKIVDAIHELLDNAFIMRFDTPDALRLTDALDDVIDGMRGAATHVDIYKRYLRVLRPEAEELVVAAESAIRALRDLVSAVSAGPMSLNRAREGAKAINDAEANADKIIARAERNLVDEFSTMETNTLEFIALEKLYSMLEQTTDDAKRCGKLIVSLIRKET